MLASQVLGSFWYLFPIERETTCWQEACRKNIMCNQTSLYCHEQQVVNMSTKTFLNESCPIQDTNTAIFNFGIFLDALQSGVVASTDFRHKFSYCFWWGLRNLSSVGQNLETSNYFSEIWFAVFIFISGLVLFSFLIGNMQTYLQSTTKRRHEQHKWQEIRGVDEENLIHNLPNDLRKDINRHICLDLLMRVPLFDRMDERLLDAVCDRLKPVLYIENVYIIREGDPVEEMLFIIQGKLLTSTTNGGRTGFFNSDFLKVGDFCGEELPTWALDPHPSSNLPISRRTVQTLSEVGQVFDLKADDLKFVAAWHRYSKKKLEESLREEENRLQDALANAGGSSPNLVSTIYASIFDAIALRHGVMVHGKQGYQRGCLPCCFRSLRSLILLLKISNRL
ncbi:cyclic nucleotide-gated ion channel 1 [Quillaja saponaria]|uniref:Cyclic nucleotide-gated ion channel 1 n=1 Tax=Quillaja saponaria TaxID=32244 RepID=A0AAD7PLM6_QUISA|nr:cyclic nucleotide-gated ion channel 1 [Quillaja saponaria]